MPRTIEREGVQRLVEQGAQLVETLPAEEYELEHLPGAINLPLRRIDRGARSILDLRRPIVVYCADSACDISPRAAWRLESLGFAEVYDYSDGKLDWVAAGLPTEATNVQGPTARDLARTDVPTCRFDERADDAWRRARSRGWDASVVVNERRIVFGILRADHLEGDLARPVEQVMLPGPSTFRPNVLISEMAAFMTEHDLESSPITTSDGRLMGPLYREEAVKAADRGSRAA
jgi:rhodanese-related sulfurtransferase